MASKTRLLFWGELPPNVCHGISLSNERILSTLTATFDVRKVEDNSCFGGPFKTLYNFFLSIIKLVSHSRSQIDIYYLNAPMSYLGLWKIYLSILAVKIFSPRVKVVAHLHRGDFIEFVKYNRNRHLFKRFSTQLKALLVLSETAANELTSSNLILTEKIKVLHNTVDPLERKELIQSFPNSIPSSSNLYCLCNYIPTKRIHNLVIILNKLSLSRVDFNGASSSGDYMATLHKLNNKSICDFDSVINGDEKYKKLLNAKALILPSLNEGMPLVILESLSQGTPVICFDIGYISDYIGTDYPGLVHELSDEALKSKISWLLKLSNNDYLSLREYSFDIFWDNFDPEIIKSSTTSIFKDL